jgi:hypothetical protein
MYNLEAFKDVFITGLEMRYYPAVVLEVANDPQTKKCVLRRRISKHTIFQ